MQSSREQQGNIKKKRAYINQQFKTEENNRMGKTRNLNKTGHIKGTFHGKMGTIKGRNSKDLIEAKEIRRGGKNTQKNYTKKVLMPK